MFVVVSEDTSQAELNLLVIPRESTDLNLLVLKNPEHGF